MKIYGNEKTNLQLSEKAFAMYSQCDPLTITEHDDGTYSLSGVEDRDNMTADDVNQWLEDLADDCGENEGAALWYAVQRDADDTDWGTGSHDFDEAVRMARRYGPEARIAVIEEGADSICIREIESADFPEEDTVVNEWGVEIKINAALELMDEDIYQDLDARLNPCSAQELFDAYCKAHEEKYGEPWELAKANPVY